MSLLERLQSSIEPAMAQGVEQLLSSCTYKKVHEMVSHHLGLAMQNGQAGKRQTGKRIRPTLTLLTAAGFTSDWQAALPWAVQIELIHNFSLIHDDIEDHSDTRRGQPTVWTLWGVPHAINTGDFMFSMAHLNGLPESSPVPAEIQLKIQRLVMQTCVDLTLGQFLDMDFEGRDDVSLDAYWQMIDGKTASLMACSTGAGALAGGAGNEHTAAALSLGKKLGLAFQVADDWLGLWGDPEVTGKPGAIDMISAKKTYPILAGLQQSALFREAFNPRGNAPERAIELTTILADAGVETETRALAESLIDECQELLAGLPLRQEARDGFDEMIGRMRLRQS